MNLREEINSTQKQLNMIESIIDF